MSEYLCPRCSLSFTTALECAEHHGVCDPDAALVRRALVRFVPPVRGLPAELYRCPACRRLHASALECVEHYRDCDPVAAVLVAARDALVADDGVQERIAARLFPDPDLADPSMLASLRRMLLHAKDDPHTRHRFAPVAEATQAREQHHALLRDKGWTVCLLCDTCLFCDHAAHAGPCDDASLATSIGAVMS